MHYMGSNGQKMSMKSYYGFASHELYTLCNVFVVVYEQILVSVSFPLQSINITYYFPVLTHAPAYRSQFFHFDGKNPNIGVTFVGKWSFKIFLIKSERWLWI